MSRPAAPHVKVELLRAAEAIFSERGLATSKVEEITARAGVSKGAFYLHFQSKEECFREIAEGFLARLATCIEDAPDQACKASGTIEEILAHIEEHDLEVFEFCWQNRTTLRLLQNGGGGTSYAYLLDEFADRAAESAQTWIALGMSRGLYREDVDPTIVSALISGAYDRLVRELIKQPRRPDLRVWSRQAIHLFTRGMLTPHAREIADRKVSTSPHEEQTTGARPRAASRVRSGRARSA